MKAPRRVRPGQRVRLRVKMQKVRGGTFTRRYRVRIPGGLKAGRRTLKLVGFEQSSPDDALLELLLGAVGTGLVMGLSATLPLRPEHASHVLVSTSLATMLAGFLLLAMRQEVLTQVAGYLVLENGIFTFGLLLVQAMPALVEIGVLLDLFVGVFVMGIIIHHVNRQFPASTSEHLSALRE